jgi:hypothetical protein
MNGFANGVWAAENDAESMGVARAPGSRWLCLSAEVEKRLGKAPWWRRLGRLALGRWARADAEAAMKIAELALSMELVGLLAAATKIDAPQEVAIAGESLSAMRPKHAAAEAARLAMAYVLGEYEAFPALPPEPERAEPLEASCFDFARQVALGNAGIEVEENLVGAFADIANWMAQMRWCDWPPKRRQADAEARELGKSLDEAASARGPKRL